MLSDFQYCIQLMLKNQSNIKTHPKNFNDKYHDFHCRCSLIADDLHFKLSSFFLYTGILYMYESLRRSVPALDRNVIH